MLFVMALLALPPPTPGGALLEDLSLRERLLLAQLPDPDAERALEQDMEGARRRLGHDEPPAAQARPDATTPARPDAAPPDGAVEPQRVPRARAPVDGAPRRREARRRVPAATVDGRGKAYYLTWGLVDWGIAGGMWLGGAYAGLASLVLVGAANDHDTSTVDRRDMRSGAVVTACIAAGLTVGGIIVARRAGHNIGTFRELRDAGRAGYSGELPPRERDDEED